VRLLILLSRIPYPLEKGDKLRAYHQIKALSKENEIILCSLTTESNTGIAKEKLAEYCAHIYFIKLPKWKVWWNTFKGLFGKLPLQVNYFYHKKAQQKIDSIIETHIPNHIFCQLIRVTEYVKKYSFIPKTLDFMDCLSAGMQRRHKSSIGLFSSIYKLEEIRLKNYEQLISHDFENLLAITHQDKTELNLTKKINVLSNGIDLNYFSVNVKSVPSYEIVFIGNLSYEPNIQCANYIVKFILPMLKKNKPNIKLLISGANPSKKVLSLQNKHVKIQGWVDDIREAYLSGSVFVAPLELGSGLQNKLLEAMSLGLPCITSHLANGALNAAENKEILLANSPKEYTDHIISLLSDQKKYNTISTAGQKYVISNYNWNAAGDQLNTILKNTKYP